MQVAPAPAASIDAAVFAGCLDRLGAGERFAIAVSGGRDSMALMRLCAAYSSQTGTDIHAYIVDHALRAGSEREASRALDWCNDAGLPARILRWNGPKPSSGVQAGARTARYKLLASAANKDGYDKILTAHTADDQAETVAMRCARGGGTLAGMKEAIFIAAGAGKPIKLLRPLLAFTRDETTATAAGFAQAYIDDPSNEDDAFERIRVRRKIRAAAPGSWLHRAALLELSGKERARMVLQREEENAAFRSLGGVFTRWGGVSLSLTRIDRAGRCVLSASLTARVIRAVSGADHAPAMGAAQELAAEVLHRGTAVLGGALVTKTQDRLWFVREPAAILGRAGVPALAPVLVPAGASCLWDRRFIVTAGECAISVRPLGASRTHADDLLSAKKGLFEGPREGLMGLPALYCGSDLIGVPGVLFRAKQRHAARPLVAERFCVDIVRFS